MHILILVLLSVILGVLCENLRCEISLNRLRRRWENTPEVAAIRAELAKFDAWRKAKGDDDAQPSPYPEL